MGVIIKDGILYGKQPNNYYTKTEIDQKEETVVAPIETSVAADNYAIGAYFIANDTLYKATTAIAIGETITPGTNCVAVNITDELEQKANTNSVLNLYSNAGFHNSIFRGKYLGDSLTSAQSAQIVAGTFDDLFVGDYWTINGVNWRIADFDPYYNCGDTALTLHHVAIVPDNLLYSTAWNATNDTSSGYVNSAVRANIKASSDTAAGAEEKVIAAFGASHVLSYRNIYPTTYSNGVATGWAWTDARVELMNEMEVYGALVWSMGGLGYEVGISKRQLSLFRLSPQFMNIRALWWLRGVRSASGACLVNYNGYANYASASAPDGVRPFFLLA